MTFSTQIWADIAPLRASIAAHPFLQSLADGTLPRATFQAYLQQDSLYLAEYARVLALAAARAPDAAARAEFSQGAAVAVQVEQALHQHFFSVFGIAGDAPAAPSPTCLGYTGYLAQTAATRSYGETVAAILPCFWIYWEVGGIVKPMARPGNPYAAWIDTYADPGFGETTARVRAIVDAAAHDAGPAGQAAMAAAFKTSARYEWMFWDAAWRAEGWPIPV